MADHRCPRCGRKFTKPSLVQRHLARKTPCTAVVTDDDLSPSELAKPHACTHCGHRFTTRDSRNRHARTSCRLRPSGSSADLAEQKLAEERRRTQELRLEVERLRASQQKVVMNQTTVINNTLHVTINTFGRESVEHITRDEVRHLLDESLEYRRSPGEQAVEAMYRAALMIYSDPDHPENITCYLADPHSEALVRRGWSWTPRPCREVYSPMFYKAKDVLFHKQPFDEAYRYEKLLKVLVAEDGEGLPLRRSIREVLLHNKHLLDRTAHPYGFLPPSSPPSDPLERDPPSS